MKRLGLLFLSLFLLFFCLSLTACGEQPHEHDFSQGSVVEPAKCGTDQEGIRMYTCSVCGETKTETFTSPESKHYYEGWLTLTEPSCETNGTRIRYCKYCGMSKTGETDMIGYHTWTLGEEHDGMRTLTCSVCHQTKEVKAVVTYADYGAKGDGVTDDADAIRAAHEYANTYGLPVKADAGATYYIGQMDKTVSVQTNTDWGDATFIIDDTVISYTDVARREMWIFTVAPTKTITPITDTSGLSLQAGAKKINLKFDRDCMILIESTESRIYGREGVNENAGDPKQELLLVDKNGNISDKTPVQYDYNTITSVKVYAIDDDPITVQGGTFVTKANDPLAENPNYTAEYYYYNRGICVTRSNATLQNVVHQVQGERWDTPENGGAPYTSFFSFECCNDSTLKNCTVQGRREFYFINKNQATNAMGSYDMRCRYTVATSFIGITQSNSITDRAHQHGVMASYYCRNVYMTDCYIDRFDCHKGLYGATITNSTLGFNLYVIGGGPLYVENVVRKTGSCFVGLRSDYGSVFNGDITLKNCTYETSGALIGGSWLSYSYGLPANVGNNVLIDNVTLTGGTTLYSLNGATVQSLTDAKNPLIPPKSITIVNMKDTLPICSNAALATAFATGVIPEAPESNYIAEFTYDSTAENDDRGGTGFSFEHGKDGNNGYLLWKVLNNTATNAYYNIRATKTDKKYATVKGSNTVYDSDTFVLSFSLRSTENPLPFAINFVGYSGASKIYTQLLSVSATGVVSCGSAVSGDKSLTTLSTGAWTDVKICFNKATAKADFYVNGEKVKSNVAVTNLPTDGYQYVNFSANVQNAAGKSILLDDLRFCFTEPEEE